MALPPVNLAGLTEALAPLNYTKLANKTALIGALKAMPGAFTKGAAVNFNSNSQKLTAAGNRVFSAWQRNKTEGAAAAFEAKVPSAAGARA
jgi:hypothetical protein